MTYPDPRYLGDSGETTAVFRPSDRDPDLTLGPISAAHYLATGGSTNGQFGLYRWEMGRRTPGASAHFHRTFSESFFVLSGKPQIFDGDRWLDASTGDFVYVPHGGVHGFKNDSDEPAAMLILFVPGAPREAYFEGIAERIAGRQFTEEEWAAFCVQHDNIFVP